MSKLRIISGKYRSRLIEFNSLNNPYLRPTLNRLRETVFNWLNPHIIDTKCLDAFAGSGALGFESLSRFAKSCDFFEIDKKTVKYLNKNKSMLKAYNAFIYQKNILNYLKDCKGYGIIFLDPPFDTPLLNISLSFIISNKKINSETVIYIEFPNNFPPANLLNFYILNKTKQGSITAYLLKKK